MKTNKISNLSQYLLVTGGIFLIISLFVPIWNIYLDAPQYPEGLGLQIWAHKIAGDVDIINGLNHYIGMKTLHTDDFIEFKVLPYIIGFFAIWFILTGVIGNRKLSNILLVAFIIFGVVAMVDFWKWEYDYGHNLDPNAAIKVPGMAYQPPLIGFKQLLNFGAFSIPALGGWLFISAGALSLAAVVLEIRNKKKLTKVASWAAILPFVALASSCGANGPEPINYNKDACTYCKMSISEPPFASQLVTSKGRVYNFDDLKCMRNYMKSESELKIKAFYIASFDENNSLFDAKTAWFVKNEEAKSPMGGNTVAFSTKEKAELYAKNINAETFEWSALNMPYE